ncbi:twin-arginine translocase TatA/TatE family subunit [Stutzerimonas nitrititolerans]|uniref:twin-arginine translocase TatA/TatE family subunit n=1 Tax=Stutzerimonas nitrititolerans TaxID=2482751 RepID=UPI0028A9E7E1|nr:twin-arginine translocase TatA/TatE family subunit [Stutzerimonas nitrititolerans]
MGLGGISVWQLLIVLLIVVMLFGSKRLKGLGSDMGEAIKGFRNSMGASEEKPSAEKQSFTYNVEGQKAEEPAKKS